MECAIKARDGSRGTEDIDTIEEFKEYFDLVFTSPPYFNRERYSLDNSQSWVRYNNLDDWMNEFFYKTLEKSWESLNKNGYLIINISDIRIRRQKKYELLKICEPMNDKISSFPNAKYLGCLNLQLGRRPGVNSFEVPSEPMWIWQKQE